MTVATSTVDEVFAQHEPLLTALMDSVPRTNDAPLARFGTILNVLAIYADSVPPVTHVTLAIPLATVIQWT